MARVYMLAAALALCTLATHPHPQITRPPDRSLSPRTGGIDAAALSTTADQTEQATEGAGLCSGDTSAPVPAPGDSHDGYGAAATSTASGWRDAIPTELLLGELEVDKVFLEQVPACARTRVDTLRPLVLANVPLILEVPGWQRHSPGPGEDVAAAEAEAEANRGVGVGVGANSDGSGDLGEVVHRAPAILARAAMLAAYGDDQIHYSSSKGIAAGGQTNATTFRCFAETMMRQETAVDIGTEGAAAEKSVGTKAGSGSGSACSADDGSGTGGSHSTRALDWRWFDEGNHAAMAQLTCERLRALGAAASGVSLTDVNVMSLSIGAPRSSVSFHAHGPALFGLHVGVKRFFLVPPTSPKVEFEGELFFQLEDWLDALRSGVATDKNRVAPKPNLKSKPKPKAPLPDGLRVCTLRAGDIIYVPQDWQYAAFVPQYFDCASRSLFFMRWVQLPGVFFHTNTVQYWKCCYLMGLCV